MNSSSSIISQSRACRLLAGLRLDWIERLRGAAFKPFKTLGAGKEEIAWMWRFTKNNGITEGFHAKMEMIQRRAYGFRNFNSRSEAKTGFTYVKQQSGNYRLRVIVLCG